MGLGIWVFNVAERGREPTRRQTIDRWNAETKSAVMAKIAYVPKIMRRRQMSSLLARVKNSATATEEEQICASLSMRPTEMTAEIYRND